MADMVIIDTNFAKRDLERIRGALGDLRAARSSYNKAIGDLNSLYKGNASAYLQGQISSIKIKKIDAMISNLEIAEQQLKTTIKQVEEANRKLKNSITSTK